LGSPTPASEVLDCSTFDAGQWDLGIGTVCLDVDCGAPVSGSNPRVVFTLVSDGSAMSNIMMATWNVAAQHLENFIALTDDQDTGITGNKNEHPAWCGNDHVVWSRYTNDSGPFNPNEFTICRMPVNSSGQSGPIECHDTTDPDTIENGEDELNERHPSCGVFNGELKIAYANSRVTEGANSLEHKICVIDRDDFEQVEICTDLDPAQDWIDQRIPPGRRMGRRSSSFPTSSATR
jgi:hypothetical protein